MSVNFDNDVLLVIAANGKVAQACLQRLSVTWRRLRLQCTSESSADGLKQRYPNAEVVRSGLREMSDCYNLLHGVTVCFMVTPAFHEVEDRIGSNMVAAAAAISKDGGSFQHFVFSSVLHPIIDPMKNHRHKRLIEEKLVTSGLNFTIVQPSHLMDNLPVKSLATQENPIYHAAFNPKTKFSFTALHDFADAVSTIVQQRKKHYFATYELVSTSEPLDYVEVMNIVSEEIGRDVEVKRPSEHAVDIVEANVSSMHTRTVSERSSFRDGMKTMFHYYDTCGLYGNSNVMRMLLERNPLSYRDWVKMQLSPQR